MPPQSPSSNACRTTARIMGQGCYVADVHLPDALHVHFLRATMAEGILTSVATEDAQSAQGVYAIHTGADVAHLGDLSVNPVLPLTHTPKFQILADTTIQAVGQSIAAVLAETPQAAADAAELIWPEIEDPDTPSLHPPIAEKTYSAGDTAAAFAAADHIVSCTIQHPRLAPSPMEPRAIAVRYNAGDDSVTIWHSTQTSHRTRSELAQILDITPDRIHVIAPDVGGAFGMKASLYPEEVFTVWAALRHKRATRWIATRSEDFLSATHGRGLKTHGRLAVAADGTFLALDATVEAPLGLWLPNSALVPAWNGARILPAGYDIDTLRITTKAVPDARAPTGIYRGAGRPEAVALMERLADKAARLTGIDPVALRKRNLLPATRLPHSTATGNILDSGDYTAALETLVQSANYATLRKAQTKRRAAGELVGLGLSFYVEPSGSGWESARVTLHADGTATVASGSSSQGHNRSRAFAKIAANALNLSPEDITVQFGDTATCPEGIGALASRSTAIGGSAVLEACREIQTRLANGETAPITAEIRYENKGQAWGFGAYLILLSIDPATGTPTVEQAHAIDDTGTVIDEIGVTGQLQGGFAQGLGEALLEAIHYDADNQLLTGSFMDYALPRAIDVPALHLSKSETPSPMNSLGAKGVGEAGTIGAPIAILNAAIDALAPLGITDLQMPLTPSHPLDRNPDRQTG